MLKYYTGIGSRNTPQNVLDLMTEIAVKLRSKGYWLRSGGAEGADTAFEKGAKKQKQIFLPWKYFNQNDSEFYIVTDEVIEFSLRYHPNANKLSDAVKKIMGRNSQQILGVDLKQPSQFVICYTDPDKPRSGTSHAIRISDSYKIPVYNLNQTAVIRRFKEFIK